MKFDDKDPDTKVLDLGAFRKKKEVAEELTRGGRSPLYVSHQTGKISGSPERPEAADFGDRLQRIRASLDKINRLMGELKKMSTDDAAPSPSTHSQS